MLLQFLTFFRWLGKTAEGWLIPEIPFAESLGNILNESGMINAEGVADTCGY
jgi:hypothetical protein